MIVCGGLSAYAITILKQGDFHSASPIWAVDRPVRHITLKCHLKERFGDTKSARELDSSRYKAVLRPSRA